VPPPTAGAARPCSLERVADGGDRRLGHRLQLRSAGVALRVFDGSVVSARRASLAAASMLPSGCRTSRPAAFAFWIAPRDSPTWAAYWRDATHHGATPMTRRATDNAKALDAFLAAKTEIDAMLERLAALSATTSRPAPTRSTGAMSAP
jgi:hypothetical protein